MMDRAAGRQGWGEQQCALAGVAKLGRRSLEGWQQQPSSPGSPCASTGRQQLPGIPALTLSGDPGTKALE